MFNTENENVLLFLQNHLKFRPKTCSQKSKRNMEDKIYPVDVTKLYFKYKDSINPECKVQVFLECHKNNVKDQFFTCTLKTVKVPNEFEKCSP